MKNSLSRGLIRDRPSRRPFCAAKPQVANSLKCGLLGALRISSLLGVLFAWRGEPMAVPCPSAPRIRRSHPTRLRSMDMISHLPSRRRFLNCKTPGRGRSNRGTTRQASIRVHTSRVSARGARLVSVGIPRGCIQAPASWLPAASPRDVCSALTCYIRDKLALS